MPTVFSDPSQTLYAALIILLAVLVGFWYRKQNSGNLIRALVVAAVLIALFLIDRLVESPREESSRKIEEMAKASQDKNWDNMMQHISESFKYKGPSGSSIDKRSFRERIKELDQVTEYKGIAVWDFHRAEFKPIDDKNIQVGFSAQIRDYPMTISSMVATFTKDPDGQWRMSGFKRYKPGKQDRDNPEPIPRLD